MDGLAAHCTNPDLLEFPMKSEVILLYLNIIFFLKTNPTRKINRFQFGSLLSSAWSKSAITKNVISAFRTNGIFALNPNTRSPRPRTRKCNNNRDYLIRIFQSHRQKDKKPTSHHRRFNSPEKPWKYCIGGKRERPHKEIKEKKLHPLKMQVQTMLCHLKMNLTSQRIFEKL